MLASAIHTTSAPAWAGAGRRLWVRHAGIGVIAIAGAELGKGRGGPRYMPCPIERDALTDT